MKFQIASDLHIEYKNEKCVNPFKYITPSAEYLILAGDIGSLYNPLQLYIFLKKLSPFYKAIFFTPGNHEYYRLDSNTHLSLANLEKRMKQMEEIIPNLFLLDKQTYYFPKQNFCLTGATLWSRIRGGSTIPAYIVKIRDFNTRRYNERHTKELNYLIDCARYCNGKKIKLVAVTHHCPSKIMVKDKKTNFKELYATDLNHILHKKYFDCWIFGHIHKNFDTLSPGKTRLVSNQLGKPKDGIKDYDPKFTINL